MDRSVDSIGSCSLDVDADSTDFSDTSGELNFLTPNSAKDIQREFTAGIKERCKIPVINCQAVTTVLDPVTGNISTVLTTTSPQAVDTATTAAAATVDGALPNKKPSYLNLACCVNGYSNLTTYDSKLRQDINKSREVSPSRPIIATLHYNRSSEGGNFQLTAPTLSYISMNNSINNNLSNGTRMVNGRNGVAAAGANATGQDVTDNVSVNAAAAMFNGNGFGGGLRTKVISSQSQISSVRESERVVKKSFIQQRVEKLYGNAEGVVINKQIYSHSNNSGTTNERKYLNNIANENVSANKNCYTTPASAVHLNGNGNANGSATSNGGGGVVTKENLDVNGAKEFGGGDPDMEALPVMRHLRPEFRAQLQLYSPKKVPKTSPGRFSNGSSSSSSNGVVSSAGSLNGEGRNNNHIASNGDHSHHHHSHLTNGKLTTNGTSSSNGTTTATSSLLSSSIFSSSTSVATVVESKTTTKSSSSSFYQTTTEEASPALSATATTTNLVTTNAANACDATAAAVNQHSEQESPSTIAVTEAVESAVVVAAAAVTAQASVEKEAATIGVEPSIPVQQQKQQQQEVSPTKMKLSEPCANGGDGVDNVAIVRNGTTTTSIKNGHHCHDGHEDKENINGGAVLPEVLPSAKVAETPVKDGNHFLQVMKNEQNRLLAMAADIERDFEQCKTDGDEISEEVAGYVLVAAGKARLLCSQKMKQFEGLCHSNLNQIPGEKFQTTNEDLQGFWDMVMLQVNDVDASFVEIDSFRRNGWKKPAPVSPVPQVRSTTRSTKLTKRPFKAPASTSATNGTADAEAKKVAAAKREASRKKLMELKRNQKLASAQQHVEIFVPGSSGSGSGSAEVSNGVTTS